MFFQPNRAEVLRRCGDGLVLDVGGWADPFHRADYVLDCFDYETRGILYNGVGRLADTVRHPDPLPGERFTRETWKTQDICGKQPFPFPDKMFDFVLCSHTLEDIRDPLRVCGELIRVAKAGYIETPSRLVEQTVGLDGTVGAPHHRWLVEMTEGRVAFTMKSSHLHWHRPALIPTAYTHRLPPETKVTWLFWNDGFEYGERIVDDALEDASRFAALHPVPAHLRIRQVLGGWKHRLKGSPSQELTGPKVENGTWTWKKLLKASLPKSSTLWT